jgi:uncharacterized membrane protein YozB (DUF420 family)
MNFVDIPFPRINATLNGISAILLLAGYGFIRAGRWRIHATCMIAAVCTSTAFLACYLTYHIWLSAHHHVLTHFPPGFWRPIYLAILETHTPLAALTLPLIFVTLRRAWRRDWPGHRRIALWTFPIWLYVSVTGVIIYWMLYHLAPMIRTGQG